MDKNEYLNRLSALLSDISYEEHEEALNYYREYIEDAGPENFEKVLEELGTPENLAGEIRSGLSSKNKSGATAPVNLKKPDPEPACGQNGQSFSGGSNCNRQNEYGFSSGSSYEASRREQRKSVMILVIIALVLASPLWIPLAGSAITAVFIIAMIPFFLVIGFGAAGVTCLAVGAALAVSGFVSLFAPPIGILEGFIQLGCGLIVFSLGIVLTLLAVLTSVYFIPAIIRVARNFIRSAAAKKKEVFS